MASDQDRQDLVMLRLAAVYLVPSNEGGVTLRTPRSSSALRGKFVNEIFPRLLPLLDGTRSRQQVINEVDSDVDPDALRHAVDRLVEVGMVEEVLGSAEGEETALNGRIAVQSRFLSQYSVNGITGIDTVNSTVALVGDGPLIPALAHMLAASGVGAIRLIGRRTVNEEDVAQNAALRPADVGATYCAVVDRLIENSALVTSLDEVDKVPDSTMQWRVALEGCQVVAVATDLPVVSSPWLDDLNKAALELSIPWTVGTLLQRATAHVGPSVIPNRTACWKCFVLRFKSNLDATDRYEEFEAFVADSVEYVNPGGIPSITSYVAGIVSQEVLRLISRDGLPVRTAGRLLTIDLWDYVMDSHNVLKLPRCPHCSPTDLLPQERVWS